MTKEELLVIVNEVIDRANGDRKLAAEKLERMCEYSPSLMVAFAAHGKAIVDAVHEGEQETKH